MAMTPILNASSFTHLLTSSQSAFRPIPYSRRKSAPHIHMTMSILQTPLRLRQSQLSSQSISLGLYQIPHSSRLLSFLLGTIRTITVHPARIVLFEFRSPPITAERVCFRDEARFMVAAFGVGGVFGPAAAGAFVVVEPAHYWGCSRVFLNPG